MSACTGTCACMWRPKSICTSCSLGFTLFLHQGLSLGPGIHKLSSSSAGISRVHYYSGSFYMSCRDYSRLLCLQSKHNTKKIIFPASFFLLTKLTMVEMQLSLLPSRHEAPGFHPQHCKTKERKGEKEEKRAKKKKELTAYSHININLVVFLF